MDKKQLIRINGIKIISRDGFSNTKVNSVVEAAGLSVGTFYNYFKDKNDLLYYIHQEEIIHQCNALLSILKSKITAKDKVESYINFLINEAIEDADLMKLIHNEKGSITRNNINSKDMKMDDLYNHYRRIIFEILDEARNENIVKNTPNSIIVTILISLITSTVNDMSIGVSDITFDELRQFLLNIIFI